MNEDDDRHIPTVCFCGRTHAPWWGRYVPAPSCKLLPKDDALHRFLNTYGSEARNAA